MLRPILTAILSLSTIFTTKANDSIWIKKDPILSTIQNIKNHTVIELHKKNELIKTGNKDFDSWDNRLIITPKSTFITINGTGHLYKIAEYKADSILLNKIDNTTFFGYNFYCIYFEYKGDIYSFGGVGLWRTNGQLRIFSETKKEWDIVALNKEIPTTNTTYYFDYNSGKLYYLSKSYFEPATGKLIEQNKWYVLDVNKKTNTEIGTVSKKIKDVIEGEFSYYKYNCYYLPEFKGSIITDHELFFKFIRFPELSMHDITDKQLLQTLKATSIGKLETLFTVDSVFYFTLAGSKQPSSIKCKSLFYNDSSSESILANGSLGNDSTSIVMILSGTLMLIGGFVYYKRKKSKKNNPLKDDENQQPIEFDPLESELIQKLKESMYNGITIPDVNDLLGLSKKPLAIQKKNRNEIIHKINNKYKMMSMSEEDLIIRKRDESDKRSFIYFFNEEATIET